MFKGRSKASTGRGNYGHKHQKVPLKGLFADGVWKCNCDPRLPAQHFQTKNGGKNHERWFYTCQNPQPKRCDFFLWSDEAKGREAAAVLSNSRTEPLPSPSLQTPRKPSPYGLATPQTSTRFRETSPDIRTPYTPSKPSPNFTSSPAPRSETQATTTTLGNDSDEEFFDWPASDDDKISKVAEQASSRNVMPPPETPRKALKTEPLSTPGKRTFHEMVSEDDHGAVPAMQTPRTGDASVIGDIFTTPSTNSNNKGIFSSTLPPTPLDTPTPIRYKDVPPSQDSELTSDILSTLQTHNIPLSSNARDAIQHVCNKHVLYTRGIMKGRDVSRAIVKTKDERIVELQGEIEGLKAERESMRAVVRHLRRDFAGKK